MYKTVRHMSVSVFNDGIDDNDDDAWVNDILTTFSIRPLRDCRSILR